MIRFSAFILLVIIAVSVISQETEENVYQYDGVVYEKLYLHIDRMMYSPGESIWFKIYLMSGVDHRLIEGNKNVYVELIDSRGKIIESRLILTAKGTANGDFKIPRNLQDGYYTVRGYTKYQQNFGDESYFHKKIWISGVGAAVERPASDNINQIEIGFYPESGTLIENASNTIAFKASDSKGHGIDVSGYVINDLGDTLTPFKTEFLGMGSFKLMPKEGRTYYTKLTDYPDYTYQFNNILTNGATLQFYDKETALLFAIVRNIKNYNTKHYRLKATHKGFTIFDDSVDVNSFYHELSYSKNRFPLGISTVTLFNIDGLKIAERIVFVKAGSFYNINVQTDDSTYTNRSKATVFLEAKLNATDSVPAGLSVSVVNRNYLNRKGLDNDLPGFLLLDSELRGAIESSASYFTDEKISSTRKLDLLMMVQGWRSYYWPEIKTIASNDLKWWDDIGLTVSGHVKRLLRDDFLQDAKVVLGPVSPGLQKMDTITDESGSYRFENLFLLDSSLLMLEATTKWGNHLTEIFPDPMYQPEISIDNTFISHQVPQPLIPRSFYSDNYSMLEAIRRHAILTGSIWLDEVTVENKVNESFFEDTRKEYGSYLGTPNRSYNLLDDDITYINIFDFFESKSSNVFVQGNQLIIRGSPAMIMVDGMPYTFPLEQILLSDIEYIDVHTNAASLAAAGDLNLGGVISLYTRSGEIDAIDRYIRGRKTEYVNGFQVPRSFYSPTYTPDNIDNINPDYRPTLYWKPYVILTENKSKLEFFTADFHSDYVVIVEGISAEGKICKGVGQFSVILN